MTSQNIKAVILAGGLGTRLSEETHLKPKPMIEIGNKPIIWHIMKIYYAFGVKDFIICCGYKGYVIKEYFYNYLLHSSDTTIDIKNNNITYHEKTVEDWKVTFVDTGENTQTGGRLKRVKKHIENEEFFFFTYGDGLSNVNIKMLKDFHIRSGKLATVTAIEPPGRYGALNIENEIVMNFKEKADDGGYINGGFFVLSPKCLDLIEGDNISWEGEPMEKLAKTNELVAFKHKGFWQAMDTLRDKANLEKYWASGSVPWKVW